VLDPEVTWRVQTPRGVVVKLGATAVATRAQRAAHVPMTAQNVFVDGEPGVVAWDASGKPRGVLACTVADGRIVEIRSVTDPARLALIDLPARPE
jgi:hypothetical protein